MWLVEVAALWCHRSHREAADVFEGSGSRDWITHHQSVVLPGSRGFDEIAELKRLLEQEYMLGRVHPADFESQLDLESADDKHSVDLVSPLNSVHILECWNCWSF